MSRARSWPIVQLVAGALTLACGYAPHTDHLTSDGCPAGAEGCPCEEDGDCAGGLACVDGSCQPGVGASTTGITGSTTSAEMTTASTSASSSGGVTTSSASTSCEFACDRDAPGDDFPCDVFAQDCPEGQKCAAYDLDGDDAQDSTRCVQVIGDGQHGEPCTAEEGKTGVDDCAMGVMCWNVDDEGVGTCVALCVGTLESPVCEPLLTTCVIVSWGPLNLCLPSCDPLTQEWCGESEVCIGDPNGDGFVCVLDASGGMARRFAIWTTLMRARGCQSRRPCACRTMSPAPRPRGSRMSACAGWSREPHATGVAGSTTSAWLDHVGVCGVAP